MGETHHRKVLMITAACVLGLVAVAWLLATFDIGGIGSAMPAARLAIPLVALVSVAAAAWVVFSGRDVDEQGEPPVDCLSCGRPIRKDWRMCPYCGSLSEDRPPARRRAAG
jgi:hypothetical protein